MSDQKSKESLRQKGPGAEDDSRHAQDESTDSAHEDLWTTIFCPEKSCEVIENTDLP
ncbi:hypothetical protein [Desulfococcus sp.]|uniref:hypothetical protein n=1 Tax=Desulfococcus sp. TaxID=2025834 RepID=UPI003593108A